MPIAKAISSNEENGSFSESLKHHQLGHIDDGHINPLKAYRIQKLEHERRKESVRAAPNSMRGFVEWIHLSVTDFVENERFQFFILSCVCVNSLMLGVVTFPIVKDDPALLATFQTADMVFLVIFSIDIAMQIFSRGIKYFKDGWCLFDLIVVLISWMSVSIYSLYALRVFRAFRLITRIEAMRNVTVAIFHVVPSLTGICFLLMLMMYIFAVLCTDLYKDLYDPMGVTSADYFGRLDISMFTLFQFICMDEWSGIAYEVMSEYSWAWLVFITFIIMTAFVIANLLIAVICDAVHIMGEAEKAMLAGSVVSDESDFEDDDSQNYFYDRIQEMEEMLDEMEITQERMAETIKYLSLALLSRH